MSQGTDFYILDLCRNALEPCVEKKTALDDTCHLGRTPSCQKKVGPLLPFSNPLISSRYIHIFAVGVLGSMNRDIWKISGYMETMAWPLADLSHCLLCARYWGWPEGQRNEWEVVSPLRFSPHHPSNLTLVKVLSDPHVARSSGHCSVLTWLKHFMWVVTHSLSTSWALPSHVPGTARPPGPTLPYNPLLLSLLLIPPCV